MIRHATDSGWKCSLGSVYFTFLTQPVAPTVNKGREPPSLPIRWHQTATHNTARERARDGLESNEKSNRPRIRFSRPGGTVSAEHLYLTSIHPCSPLSFYFLNLLDALPLLFYKSFTLCSGFFCGICPVCEVFPTRWATKGSTGGFV